MTTKLSQKEYLKKYLSSDKSADKKKKKKKSKTVAGQSVKIIDDDIDLSKLHQIADEDLEVFAIGEDAPTIVGVLDDRPPELIAKEDYKNNCKWKVIADDDGFSSSLRVQHTDQDGNVSRSTGHDSSNRKSKKIDSDGDLSPPRVKRKKGDDRNSDMEPRKSVKNADKPRTSRFADASPPRRRRNSSSSDNSPPRRISPPSRRRKSASSDNSPPRRIKEEPHSPSGAKDSYKSRRNSDSDQSPPRTKSHPVTSPVRRKIKQEPDSDESPPRRRVKMEQSDSDQSPPRKNKVKQERDVSPSRRRSRSPRRRRSRSARRSRSPRRPRSPRRSRSPDYRRDRSDRYDKPSSSSYQSTSNRDKRKSRSPAYRRRSPHRNTSPRSRRDRNSPVAPVKMTKTLDGKTAGLQDAKSLRMETDSFKKREEEMFNKMSADVLGRNAEAVVRDRKTGRIRDLGEEAAREHEKLVKEQERKNLYDKWGKGLKQMEDYRSRLQDDLHETSKPLARYSDDKDLEDLLKKQERDGDPMLAYIRNKKDSAIDKSIAKPIYQGAYPENRFGIRPGYRWDGVDRSNGYETKWFDVQSKRKAGEEEAYKYSTEDM